MSTDVECSFCGQRAGEVRAMARGPNVRICADCVEICWDRVRPVPGEPPAAPRDKRAGGGDDGDALHCTFCGKPEGEVARLVGGAGKLIRDACIRKARTDLSLGADPAGAEQPPGRSCSFCGKSQSEVAKIIAGPSVNICDECVALCQNVFSAPARAGPAKTPAAEVDGDAHPQLYCSFCGEPRDGERRLIAGPTVFICNDCVAICVDLCAGKDVPGDDPPDGG